MLAKLLPWKLEFIVPFFSWMVENVLLTSTETEKIFKVIYHAC